MSQWGAHMSVMRAERTKGETKLEGSHQNASFSQEKGFGEASVLPHWKLEEVSFLQAGRFHPTAVPVLMKVTTKLFSGSKCITWPFWSQ